jgi:hypothetical protein
VKKDVRKKKKRPNFTRTQVAQALSWLEDAQGTAHQLQRQMHCLSECEVEALVRGGYSRSEQETLLWQLSTFQHLCEMQKLRINAKRRKKAKSKRS